MIDKITPKASDVSLIKAQQATEHHSVAGTDGFESATGKKDEVSLSGSARELNMALQAVQRAPDVRAEKVALLREQIEAGTYEVSLERLADSLLRGT